MTTKYIDKFIEEHQKYEISEVAVEEIKKTFTLIKERINGFEKRKRFYILETMNFFEGQISLGKLIPAILLFNGIDQQKAIYSFTRPTFLSINNNISRLTSMDHIFDPKKIYVERTNLFHFLAEISKSLIPLFDKKYLKKFKSTSSEVDLMLQIINDGQKKKQKVKKVDFME